MKKIICLCVCLFCFSTAQAGVILSGGSVIDSSMGEYSGSQTFGNMLDQSGLSTTYISGVTDFSTFTSSGVTHGGFEPNSWLSAKEVYSGYVTFDLGAEYSIEDFVMWNGAIGINTSVNGFSLTTSLFSDFRVSTLVGNFSGHRKNYDATVYDMINTTAQYIRLDITGNFDPYCCTAIGEIAFNANSVESVPEPTSIILLGLGLVGMGFSRKKKTT